MSVKKGLLVGLVTMLLALALANSGLTAQDSELLTEYPYLGHEIVISDLDNIKYLPSVAYNSIHNEYLVVWHTVWAIGTRDIRGARISAAGQVLSEFTVYEHATKDSSQAAVEYDPVNDRYLVVWVFDSFGDGSDRDLYGRFIPWDGPSLGLTEFPICTWPTHQWTPKLAYGRAVEEFLVVWNNQYQAGTLPMYISGRRITAANGSFPGSDSDFTINHLTEQRVNADVTYNLARNEYLVVYDNTWDILGRRFTGNLGHDFGGEFPIAGWPDGETKPSVAACKEANQYLVVWQSDQNTSLNSDAIYGRFISGDGTPGSAHLIDDTTASEVEADVACNAAGTQYMVAWQTMYTNSRFGIWARLVQPNGTLESAFAIVHPYGDMHRRNPVIGSGGANYLVAWEHSRDSYQDIHGRIITPQMLFLPQVLRD
jgi:hypothetical protein